ncbi:hypothetical protein [Aquimarina sp. 2201CG5-10]|uniref:hypothetical protein n=1 Tax=Aquimarina callyspongiae TaxID=3098150 RepID=UPI002AB36F04|nr:hypothetical protein [Aquimarina sp. 2201CG5-10]MDY8138421.1 hypothetical protein [Aquimarina sp. 2201CG5-10]
MRLFLFTILCFVYTLPEIDINDIRTSFKHSHESEVQAEQFYEITEKAVKEEKAIYTAYHGAALTLKAAHCNFFSKLSYFKKGKKLVEKAIEEEPDNIEIRMIRLCIQYNVPKILGYYKEIESDKDFILTHVDQINSPDLKKYIEGFIVDSEIFSEK